MKRQTHKPAVKRDCCEACGVAWVVHPGLVNQCHRHQVALQCLEKIATLKRGGLAKRLAVATLALLKYCK